MSQIIWVRICGCTSIMYSLIDEILCLWNNWLYCIFLFEHKPQLHSHWSIDKLYAFLISIKVKYLTYAKSIFGGYLCLCEVLNTSSSLNVSRLSQCVDWDIFHSDSKCIDPFLLASSLVFHAGVSNSQYLCSGLQSRDSYVCKRKFSLRSDNGRSLLAQHHPRGIHFYLWSFEVYRLYLEPFDSCQQLM